MKGETMNKYIIVTESGADLPIEIVNLHKINVLPMHIVIDGLDYKDGAIPVKSVYDYHERTKRIPATSAVNPNEYQSMFRKISSENPGCIIIHIGYTSKASCTYNNALLGAEDMKNIYHVDSLNVSGGEAAIVLKAVELIENNPDIQPADLVKEMESFVELARVSFIPGDLQYLKAGGRLSNAAYMGASILKLKPLIEILDGKLVATRKFRGSMSSIAEKYLNEYLGRYNFDKEKIYLIYSLGLEEKIKMRMEDIAKGEGFKKIIWIQAGCVISSHSGPGAVGIAGFEVQSK
jgi:DegV family protein with EDD domain